NHDRRGPAEITGRFRTGPPFFSRGRESGAVGRLLACSRKELSYETINENPTGLRSHVSNWGGCGIRPGQQIGHGGRIRQWQPERRAVAERHSRGSLLGHRHFEVRAAL